MLPGWLRNTTRQTILATPDSIYEWRRKGEHVIGFHAALRLTVSSFGLAVDRAGLEIRVHQQLNLAR